MISDDKITTGIFKILKGNGYNIELFTEEGENTIDPNNARRFYVKDMGAMVNFETSNANREIRVSVSQSTSVEQLKDTLAQLKNLANKSIVEYTLKSFSKAITPKDQDFEAQKARDMKQDVQEGISTAYGSTKSSYQKLESAKLVIKHTKPVNEETRGSRSRNISAIYIENADGERHKFPSKNLAGGRAMLRHIQQGGQMHDDLGEHIIEQCKELSKLKEFKKYSQRNGLVNEETNDILEAVTARIEHVRETISKMKGSKGYAAMRDTFESRELKINERDKTSLRNQFTVRHFDENLEDALPYVNSIMKEINGVKEANIAASNTVKELAEAIAEMETINFTGADPKSDPENPLVNEHSASASANTQLAMTMKYFSEAVCENEKLSGLLEQFGSMVTDVTDQSTIAAGITAVKNMMPKLSAKTSESSERNTVDYEAQFESTLDSYEFDDLFK